MPEKTQSFQLNLGHSKRISLLSGTVEVFQFTPQPEADVTVEIKITEVTP